MNEHLAIWWRLSTREKGLLTRFIFCLPWISFSLRVFGYLKTRQWLSRLVDKKKLHVASENEMAKAIRDAELLAVAGRRGLITASCLPQSVLLEYWLQGRGLNAEIKIGVRKELDLFDAHAWVELNGIALAQDDLTHHRVLQ